MNQTLTALQIVTIGLQDEGRALQPTRFFLEHSKWRELLPATPILTHSRIIFVYVSGWYVN